MTPFSNKCDILGELYEQYREDRQFKDFIEYNDLGLPLAYFSSEGLVILQEDAMRFVEETWELFVASLNIKDTGFNNLNEMLDSVTE